MNRVWFNLFVITHRSTKKNDCGSCQKESLTWNFYQRSKNVFYFCGKVQKTFCVDFMMGIGNVKKKICLTK